MSFKLKEYGKIKYYIDEKIESAGGLLHIFTTRHGGFSSGPLFSMNMSPTRDNPETVRFNYKAVCMCENIPAERCVLSQQTHTTNIRIVNEEDAGKGIFKESDIKDIDGLVTNVKNLPIVIFYADCVPILLYDSTKKVVAAVHAGWKGTVNNIAGKAIDIMVEKFGCNPGNILAAIGPSIGSCCFETGPEVAEKFISAGLSEFVEFKGEKFYIDLQSVNEHFMKNNGVENINISHLCTKCNTADFFSHRGCGADTGRMALIACIK